MHTFKIWCGSDKDDYLNDTEIINGIDNTITIEKKKKGFGVQESIQ